MASLGNNLRAPSPPSTPPHTPHPYISFYPHSVHVCPSTPSIPSILRRDDSRHLNFHPLSALSFLSSPMLSSSSPPPSLAVSVFSRSLFAHVHIYYPGSRLALFTVQHLCSSPLCIFPLSPSAPPGAARYDRIKLHNLLFDIISSVVYFTRRTVLHYFSSFGPILMHSMGAAETYT